jgi:HEAT repeat protein
MSGVGSCTEGSWIWERVQEWCAAPDARALPALVALLRIEDPWFPESTKVRRAAAWALGQLGLDAVDQLLDDPNGGELAREGAADALGYVHDAEAVNRLHALAIEGTPRVVLWAALSLAKHGESAVDALRDGLERAVDFRSAAHLADALRIVDSPSARTALDRHLATTTPDWADAMRELLTRRALLERCQTS